MKLVYRCLSGSAAHQWIEKNKREQEYHETTTMGYEDLSMLLEGAFNTMAVAVKRERIPEGDFWRWAFTYNVYHSDNDGGGREEINLVKTSELRA